VTSLGLETGGIALGPRLHETVMWPAMLESIKGELSPSDPKIHVSLATRWMHLDR
jgi:hypothetical protein